MRLLRYSPLLLLGVVPLAAWYAGLLSAAQLGPHIRDARALAAAHPNLAPLAYVALYGALVAASIPTGTLLTITGGALFGPLLGSALALVAATAGAVILFLIARGTVGAALERRHGARLAQLRPRLERDGFTGLLALRLLPVVPFWLLNIAPALAGMRLLPYALATLIGILPGVAMIATIGADIAGSLADGASFDPATLLRPAFLLPRLGLGLLALTPPSPAETPPWLTETSS